MTVLLNSGQKPLNETLGEIVDAFLTDADLERGVFLKPNIVFPVKAKSGEITNPELVRALVQALRARKSDIDIVIGEGVAAGCDSQENFQVSGYAALAEELNVPLLNLDNAPRKKVAWKFGTLELPAIAFERTYINLPILKPSSACVISGALKNQKGLLLPVVKKRFHHHGLHEQVAELNAASKPALTILDGSLFFGRGVLIAGDNCGEIDAAACKLLNIEEPEHVKLARSAGVFSDGYEIRGDTIPAKDWSAELAIREYKSIGRLRLWSNPLACTGCRAVFRDIKTHMLKKQNFLAGLKFLGLSVKGAEIVMGNHPIWRKEHSTVICIGACTHRIAKEGGYIFIPGCPPTMDDVLKYLP